MPKTVTCLIGLESRLLIQKLTEMPWFVVSYDKNIIDYGKTPLYGVKCNKDKYAPYPYSKVEINTNHLRF